MGRVCPRTRREPVRVGNAAYRQRQWDIFGEVMIARGLCYKPRGSIGKTGSDGRTGGHFADIDAEQGITKHVKGTGLTELWDRPLEEVKAAGDQTIVFTNFVDFDSAWVHRRDGAGASR